MHNSRWPGRANSANFGLTESKQPALDVAFTNSDGGVI